MYERELQVALSLAKKAGTLQLSSRFDMLAIEKKEDSSPVSQVDKACEQLISESLAAEFPDDGFLGEESGDNRRNRDRCWIVDPLDGTRPYLRGIPTYSVLIALTNKGTPVLGVIELPALSITCWGTAGAGAFLNGDPIHVSSTARIEDAMGSALGFVENTEIHGKQLLAYMRALDYCYGFMDAYSYVCIASGKLDICVNLLDKPWDCAAAACIVKEAGGRYSDIDGVESVFNGSIVLSNGLLHNNALAHFR